LALASWLGTKKQDFWPKINFIKIRLPNFVYPFIGWLSKNVKI
jgi:hypothetical protein